MVLENGALPDKLDDILAAVKETSRGRWFLESYENRLRATDTTKILGAIAKLEKHIQTMEVPDAESGLLTRARAAIAQARKDILELPGKPPELTAEGHLFAKLASLSKQHFPSDSVTGTGIDRALRLVADLDLDLAAATKPAESQHYFKQDEAVFEPAPAPKPVLVTKRNDPPIDLPPRGAKLVIQRTASTTSKSGSPAMVFSPAPQSMQDVFVTEPTEMQPAPVETPKTYSAAPELPQSRIVIIRRKADEMDEVPLFENSAGFPATAA